MSDAEAETATGSVTGAEELAAAKERSWRTMAAIDAAYAAGELDQAGWHAAVLAVLEPAYLAADNPRAQSGHSGDVAHWRRARGLLVDALPEQGGSFLDIGCANGHLMETLTEWAAERGTVIDPYGVDISPRLAALARQRCPQWADRIWSANAMGWQPPRRFDIVRTGLDYVPPATRPAYLKHLMTRVLVPGGRLIVGVFNEETDRDTLEQEVASYGSSILAGGPSSGSPWSGGPSSGSLWSGGPSCVTGRTRRPHRHPALSYKAFWISDKGPE
ncbi:class I SAM-dependent methyltransferase [Streptacidiphilus sp. N1-10]|uniref:Class I SAM-dependent methyltransferase n=1 Tax=Streptacidiphilus jeojiensis TaxID=3229225 RepID=A0ABV6XQV4_9ACTN